MQVKLDLPDDTPKADKILWLLVVIVVALITAIVSLLRLL